MQKLIDILSEILECDDIEMIKNNQFMEFESWDSLNHIRLILKLEEEFEMKLSGEEIAKINSYDSLKKVIEAKKWKKK